MTLPPTVSALLFHIRHQGGGDTLSEFLARCKKRDALRRDGDRRARLGIAPFARQTVTEPKAPKTAQLSMFSPPKPLDDAGQTHRKKDVCLLLWQLELCGNPRD